MTRRFHVAPTAATAQPGDRPRDVDLDSIDGSGRDVADGAADAADAPEGGAGAAFVGRVRAPGPGGPAAVEVVVDGWRFELEVEAAARAALRRRATRERDAAAASGPTEIRAIIPGRVATVRIAVGDEVEAGQGLLVVEAMKMQNELRAARAGTVERVAVEEGQTIDNGDLLVVIR